TNRWTESIKPDSSSDKVALRTQLQPTIEKRFEILRACLSLQYVGHDIVTGDGFPLRSTAFVSEHRLLVSGTLVCNQTLSREVGIDNRPPSVNQSGRPDKDVTFFG